MPVRQVNASKQTTRGITGLLKNVSPLVICSPTGSPLLISQPRYVSGSMSSTPPPSDAPVDNPADHGDDQQDHRDDGQPMSMANGVGDQNNSAPPGLLDRLVWIRQLGLTLTLSRPGPWFSNIATIGDPGWESAFDFSRLPVLFSTSLDDIYNAFVRLVEGMSFTGAVFLPDALGASGPHILMSRILPATDPNFPVSPDLAMQVQNLMMAAAIMCVDRRMQISGPGAAAQYRSLAFSNPVSGAFAAYTAGNGIASLEELSAAQEFYIQGVAAQASASGQDSSYTFHLYSDVDPRILLIARVRYLWPDRLEGAVLEWMYIVITRFPLRIVNRYLAERGSSFVFAWIGFPLIVRAEAAFSSIFMQRGDMIQNMIYLTTFVAFSSIEDFGIMSSDLLTSLAVIVTAETVRRSTVVAGYATALGYILGDQIRSFLLREVDSWRWVITSFSPRLHSNAGLLDFFRFLIGVNHPLTPYLRAIISENPDSGEDETIPLADYLAAFQDAQDANNDLHRANQESSILGHSLILNASSSASSGNHDEGSSQHTSMPTPLNSSTLLAALDTSTQPSPSLTLHAPLASPGGEHDEGLSQHTSVPAPLNSSTPSNALRYTTQPSPFLGPPMDSDSQSGEVEHLVSDKEMALARDFEGVGMDPSNPSLFGALPSLDPGSDPEESMEVFSEPDFYDDSENSEIHNIASSHGAMPHDDPESPSDGDYQADVRMEENDASRDSDHGDHDMEGGQTSDDADDSDYSAQHGARPISRHTGASSRPRRQGRARSTSPYFATSDWLVDLGESEPQMGQRTGVLEFSNHPSRLGRPPRTRATSSRASTSRRRTTSTVHASTSEPPATRARARRLQGSTAAVDSTSSADAGNADTAGGSNTTATRRGGHPTSSLARRGHLQNRNQDRNSHRD